MLVSWIVSLSTQGENGLRKRLFPVKTLPSESIDSSVPHLTILGLLNSCLTGKWKRRRNFRKCLTCIQRYPQRCSLPPRILNWTCRLLLGRPSFCQPLSFKKASLMASEPPRARVYKDTCDLPCCLFLHWVLPPPWTLPAPRGQVFLSHPPGTLLTPWHLSPLTRTLPCL